jgi:hypothetical protein
MSTRNRIKSHRRLRAGDLLPHEINDRSHPEDQINALSALYEQVGFARSLLAYEMPDGRLKLIDGHLRRDLDPDRELAVEILDVTDEEANVLLLGIDPLAALARAQHELQTRLMELTPTVSPELRRLWESAATTALDDPLERPGKRGDFFAHEFYVLIRCRDERH